MSIGEVLFRRSPGHISADRSVHALLAAWNATRKASELWRGKTLFLTSDHIRTHMIGPWRILLLLLPKRQRRSTGFEVRAQKRRLAEARHLRPFHVLSLFFSPFEYWMHLCKCTVFPFPSCKQRREEIQRQLLLPSHKKKKKWPILSRNPPLFLSTFQRQRTRISVVASLSPGIWINQ